MMFSIEEKAHAARRAAADPAYMAAAAKAASSFPAAAGNEEAIARSCAYLAQDRAMAPGESQEDFLLRLATEVARDF